MYASERKGLGKYDNSQMFEGLLCRRKVRFALCSYRGQLGPGEKQVEISGRHVSVYLLNN